jgi:hypothetical protein
MERLCKKVHLLDDFIYLNAKTENSVEAIQKLLHIVGKESPTCQAPMEMVQGITVEADGVLQEEERYVVECKTYRADHSVNVTEPDGSQPVSCKVREQSVGEHFWLSNYS